jgi:flagella basal body P-ring formation protein FlgA
MSKIQVGEPVVARIETGIFKIERTGVALQPAEPGQPFFLLTADRDVLRAELIKEE